MLNDEEMDDILEDFETMMWMAIPEKNQMRRAIARDVGRAYGEVIVKKIIKKLQKYYDITVKEPEIDY